MRDLKDKSLEQLAKEFGVEASEKIAEEIEYCLEENHGYELALIKESKNFSSICFSTFAYSWIYEIRRSNKTIFRKSFVGHNDCRQALKLMNTASKKKEKQQALESSLPKENII